MEQITDYVPSALKDWVNGLSPKKIAQILTTVGYASSSMDKSSKNNAASASIGIRGENEVEAILHERYTVNNTAKTGKCGDFVITVNGIRILIEVKKYSKTVPSIEVDKFYRDIDSNASINGAVMISLTSKIVGINRSMEYTHQHINGSDIPVIFLSLGDIDISVSKTSIHTSIDIILADVESRKRYIDIGDNISSVVDDIDKNLDFLSQCHLIVHETQCVVNKQMGKLMQHVLSAEINIKNSIKILRVKVDGIVMTKCSLKEAIAELKIQPDSSKYNLLVKLIDDRPVTLSVPKNTIQTVDKKLSVKITKSIVKVHIPIKLKESISIDGAWSYNGKGLTIELTENTIQAILAMICN